MSQPIYRFYPEEKVIREQPTMKRPTTWSKKYWVNDGTEVDRHKYDEDWLLYRQHIASLKSYHAEGLTSQHEGKELEKDKHFFISCNHYEGGWCKCSLQGIDKNIISNCINTIQIAIPIEHDNIHPQNPGDAFEKHIVDTLAEEIIKSDVEKLKEELEYWKNKYGKCINIIKRFDAGIIGMYDL